jgi:hypothetical protein
VVWVVVGGLPAVINLRGSVKPTGRRCGPRWLAKSVDLRWSVMPTVVRSASMRSAVVLTRE